MSKERDMDHLRAVLEEFARREREPDYTEALINLIDAMRAYIKVDVAIADELLREGQITRTEYTKGMIETKQLMMILRKFEEHGIDPSLGGVIKEPRR